MYWSMLRSAVCRSWDVKVALSPVEAPWWASARSVSTSVLIRSGAGSIEARIGSWADQKSLHDGHVSARAYPSPDRRLAEREALIAGVRDVDALGELAHTRMRPKIPQLRRALEGRFGVHHALMLQMHLDHVDQLSANIERLDVDVDRVIRPFSEQLQRLITIPGVGRRATPTSDAECRVSRSPSGTPPSRSPSAPTPPTSPPLTTRRPNRSPDCFLANPQATQPP